MGPCPLTQPTHTTVDEPIGHSCLPVVLLPRCASRAGGEGSASHDQPYGAARLVGE